MAGLADRKHVFFDLDDTLWDFEKNSSKVIRELFSEFELESKLNASFFEFYEVYKAVNHQLWTRFYLRQIDRHYLRNQRFHLAFLAFAYDNYKENLLITQHYFRRSPQGKLLKEGCLETLDYLKERFSLHIFTNGFKETQHIKLQNSGLSPYFSTVLISEEHGLAKPDKKIFRLAESMAGTTRDQCVMIGDNLDCDVQGALNAGWEAIYFSEKKPEHYKGHHITSLGGLPLLFEI